MPAAPGGGLREGARRHRGRGRRAGTGGRRRSARRRARGAARLVARTGAGRRWRWPGRGPAAAAVGPARRSATASRSRPRRRWSGERFGPSRVGRVRRGRADRGRVLAPRAAEPSPCARHPPAAGAASGGRGLRARARLRSHAGRACARGGARHPRCRPARPRCRASGARRAWRVHDAGGPRLARSPRRRSGRRHPRRSAASASWPARIRWRWPTLPGHFGPVVLDAGSGALWAGGRRRWPGQTMLVAPPRAEPALVPRWRPPASLGSGRSRSWW